MHHEQNCQVVINTALVALRLPALTPLSLRPQQCIGGHVHPVCAGFKVPSSADLAPLWVIVVLLVLLIKSIERRLSVLMILCGAVGHGISHKAELAEEDLPEEQIDPRVKDLVERGQTNRCQKEITVQMHVVA